MRVRVGGLFFCKVHDYLRHPQNGHKLTTSELATLKTRSFLFLQHFIKLTSFTIRRCISLHMDDIKLYN